MRFIDYCGMASRNLFRQKSRTILTIIAITIGSLSLILMTSLILSVHKSLIDQFKDFGAFDLVTVIKDPNSVNNNSLFSSNGDPSQGKKIDDTTLSSLRAVPHVSEATGVISNLGVSTMKLEGQEKKTWASLAAFDPNNDVFDLPIASGRMLIAADLDKIIIGNRFVEDMGYGGKADQLIGKKIWLNYRSGGGSAPDWDNLPEKPPLNASRDWYDNHQNNGIDIPVEIVGVTKSGALDDGQSYVTLTFARRLLTRVSWQMSGDNGPQQQGFSPTLSLVKEDGFKNDGYSTIVLKVDNTTNLSQVADSVKALGYGANTAQKMLDQINKILMMVGAVLAVIGGISLFVATIGIVNTMVMATYERIREIGVMRACGATRAMIRRLFTFEAALLGLWGGIFGMLLSLGLGQVGGALIRSHGASLGSLPIDDIGHFPLWLIIAVIAFTTLLGMISGLVPAIRAARMDPVEALRYD